MSGFDDDQEEITDHEAEIIRKVMADREESTKKKRNRSTTPRDDDYGGQQSGDGKTSNFQTDP